ncbi:MAG: extracellular solute-binding protein [Candidatus Bathyarchaeia archaeon]
MSEERKVSRRKYVAYAGAGVVIVAGAAAGAYYATRKPTPTPTPTPTVKPTPTPTPTPTVKPTPTPTPTPVVVNILSSSPFDTVTRYWSPSFEKMTGIKAVAPAAPATGVYDAAMTDFMGHSGSYDAVEYCYEWLADFVEGGYVVELEPFIDKYDDWDFFEDVVPSLLEMYAKWGGKIYGIPFDGDSRNYYYRKDLFQNPEIQSAFEKAFGYPLDVPKNFDQYRDIAKFFTETTKGKYVKYGCSEALHRGRMAVWYFTERLYGYGGLLFNKDGTPGVNSELGIKAMNNIIECLKYAPPGAIDYEFQENENEMVFGNIAQQMNWGNIWTDVSLNEHSFAYGKKPTDPDWPLGAAPSPGVAEGGHTLLAGGWSYVINKDSKHPEETYRFLIYMCRMPQSVWQNIHPETGVQPSLKSHFTDPTLIKTFGKEFLDAYLNGMISGLPDLRFPHGPEMLDYLDEQVSRMAAGQVRVEEGLDDVAKKWTELCKKYFGSDTLPDEYLKMQGII